MTKKSVNDGNSTLKFWENFQLETLNQKVCRVILGVYKNCSRLGTLSELGRFPLLVKALCHVLKYQAQVSKLNDDSFVSKMVQEIKVSPCQELNTWLVTKRSKSKV